MKKDDIQTLIRYRLKQAETALDDAEFLLEGKRKALRVSLIELITPCFIQPWHYYKALGKSPPNMLEW